MDPAATPTLDRWRQPVGVVVPDPVTPPDPVDPVDPIDPGDDWESKFLALVQRVQRIEDYLKSATRPFGG